jgi:uncharacterized protein (DUF302 family)
VPPAVVCLLLIPLLLSAPALAQHPPEPPPARLSGPEDTPGMISIPSAHSVTVTAERVERLIRERGLPFFGKIDHRALAEKAKLSLRPTILILFGQASTSTLLMHQNQTFGLDLPFKYLIWQAPDGKVYLTWNNPYYLAQRHGLSAELELLATSSQLLGQIAHQAAHSGR